MTDPTRISDDQHNNAPAVPIQVNDAMAIAFHNALSDGPIDLDEMDDIKTGLNAALANVQAPAPAVPQGGPVVWRYELATSVDSEGAGTGWRWHLTEGMPNVPDGMVRNLTPYTPKPATDLPDGVMSILRATHSRPLGYINAGNLQEMQSGSLPYAYLYPERGVGVSVPVYAHNNTPAVPQTVYLVENRTCLLAYASREAADKAVAGMPASVGGGFLVSPVQVFGAATPAPAPSQEVALTEQRTYRLLRAGIDKIEAADEFLSDDANTWAVDPNGIFVGMTYMGNVLRPGRRAIIAALRAKGGK